MPTLQKCGTAEEGCYLREVRHDSMGTRRCVLELEARKWQCKACGRHFRQRFPGVLLWQRASEPFRRSVFLRHWDGISRSRLGKREGIGSATVERWSQYFLLRQNAERGNTPCPTILGIDEHFFTGAVVTRSLSAI